MIIPINGHMVIEPLKHEEFMASVKETYDEVGIVLVREQPLDGTPTNPTTYRNCNVGDTVYFDSWMCSKFPKGDGTFYWIVPYENIKAYEPKQDTIPE
jgi:co-chaperonin GroES (HSP10)